MIINADIFPIEARFTLSIPLGDDNLSLLNCRSNLCFVLPFHDCERSITCREIKEELVEVLHPSLGARTDIFSLTVGPSRDHLMETIGMPYRSKCDLCCSVKFWLQAPRTNNFSCLEEKSEQVVPFLDAEIAPLSFEECKRLFRVDLNGSCRQGLGLQKLEHWGSPGKSGM